MDLPGAGRRLYDEGSKPGAGWKQLGSKRLIEPKTIDFTGSSGTFQDTQDLSAKSKQQKS